MKELRNKEINVLISTIRQEGDRMIKVEGDYKTTYKDLLVQLIKTPKGQEGLGDLEEQHKRFKILEKIYNMNTPVELKSNEIIKPDLQLEQPEVELLKSILPFFKISILDKGLIEFQQKIKDL